MEESSNENGPPRPEEKVTEKKKREAKDAWDKVNKKRERKGKKISEEEKEAQKAQIEKGRLPTLLKFFLSSSEQREVVKEASEDPKLKDFIEEIEEYKKKDAVTDDYKKEMRRAINTHENDGDISAEDAQKIRSKLGEESQRSNGDSFPVREAAGGRGGGDREPPAPPEQPIPEPEESSREGDDYLETSRNNSRQRQQQEAKAAGYRSIDEMDADEEAAIEEGRGINIPKEYLSGEMDKKTAKNLLERRRPDSINEVALLVILNEGAKWAPDGETPLLDKEGNINQGNFLVWIRERMLHYHTLDLNNPRMDLLSMVGTETEYRKIPIIDMFDKQQRYFYDQNKDEILTKFAKQALNEVYLFTKNRNNEINYRFAMGNDERLPEVLAEIHQTNDFINPDNLKMVMTLPGKFEGKSGDDTNVGDATRKAYEIYYHASDFDQLKNVVLSDNPEFFERKTFENAARYIVEKQTGKTTSVEELPKEYVDIINSMFNGNKPNIAGFIQVINPYNEPEKTGSHLELTREAIRQTLANKYDLDDGMSLDPDSRQRDSARTNLEYAEWWAYSMALWTGAGARNDTSAIGYNALTKIDKIQAYRERQSRAGRAGSVGNEYDIAVIKSLSMDLFNGIETESRETPFEIFMQLDQAEKEGKSAEERKRIANKLKFKQNTQVSYSTNHINRAFQVYQGMASAQELKLEEIIKFEPFRGVVFDRGKFEEQVNENFLKPMRYVYSTYKQIDYSKTTRIIDREATAREGRFVYKDVTVAEKMFGPVVLEEFYKKDGTIDKEKLKDRDIGKILWKNAARARIAAHIKSHRELGSGYAPFNMAMVEQLYQALETIQEIDVSGDEKGFTRGERAFSKEDIKWMRKYSGTTVGSMFMKEIVGKSGSKGIGLGLWDGLKLFFQGVFQ